jgi:POT family proton-dependent oligopeptide transporter
MISALWKDHPVALRTLFFTEMWERFSYYGMRAILVLAMVAATQTGGLGLDRDSANAIYGLYTAGVYLASLPGGWIADRLIGQQRAVWYGGLLIAAGHFTLAIPDNLHSFFIGLVLVALGTGLLKPNISAMVGALYPEGGGRRDAGFSIFYMGINLGAFVGQLLCGFLGEKIGWHWGFGAAGVFMCLGLVYYRLTLPVLGEVGRLPVLPADPQAADARQRRDRLLVGAATAVLALFVAAAVLGWIVLDPVRLSQYTAVGIVSIAAAFLGGVVLFGGLDAQEKRRVGVIAILFVAAAVFWSGFEQAGSSFNLFAQDHTDRRVFGWEMPASWLQATNPLLIILLAPFFAALWVHLGRRNLNPSVPAKFALGLLQLAAGFLVLALAARFVVAGEKVLPTWLLLTYLFHTAGELCLSPVGLSAVTQLAPKRYLGQMMGIWFMAASLGHVIAGLLAGSLSAEDEVAQMPDRFLQVTLIVGGAGLLLALCLGPIRRLGGLQK